MTDTPAAGKTLVTLQFLGMGVVWGSSFLFMKVALAGVAVLAGLAGIALAYRVYYQHKREPIEPEILADGWRFDSSIAALAGGPGRDAFEATASFDRTVIDGAVNGIATLVRGSGTGLRKVQNGFVRSYALAVAVGVVAMLAYFLSRVTF